MRLSRRALASKDLPLGNIVNPRASNPLQREDFRSVAPASQPEYQNEATAPVKTHDIDTIAYAKKSARLFREPQTLVVSVAGGPLTVEERPREGTPDAPYMPVATAQESQQVLRVDVLAELQEAFAVDWTKADVPLPGLGISNYRYGEVGPSEWDRHD